jgi:ornithine cyclodeaminase
MKGKKVKFLYLSEEDMKKAGVLNISKCVEVIDETFKLLGKGDYLMGGPRENEHGIMIWFPEKKRFPNMPVAGPDRRFMAMVAYLGGKFNICGEKWYGSNIENPRKRRLPRSILTVILNDPVTAEPLAFMSANLVSAMRTGAVPGVAAKYLAKDGAENVGVIGCGVINKACLMAIAETQKDLKEVKVFDIVREKAEAFCDEMSKKLNLQIYPVNSLKESVVEADIISVAAAGEKKVAIKTEWLKEGSLLTLTGTADLTDECYIQNKVVVDNWKMHKAWLSEGKEHPKGIESITSWAPSGQLLKLVNNGRKDEADIDSLGDVALGKAKGRKDNKEKVIFITGGMPVEDIAWAYTIYEEAKKKKIGQELTLWEEPHWF